MQFTDFSTLQNAIRRLGIDKFEAELLEKLQLGELEGNTQNPENLILGKYGIYHLEKGILAKVILHIADIETRWLEKKYTAWEAFNAKRYDVQTFIKGLHKYHFTKCTTLNTMFESDRENRYYMAQRMNGKFSYSIIKENKVIYKNKNQKLNVCKNCLTVLEELAKEEYSVQDFKPIYVFDTNVPPPSNGGFDLECNAVPNIYAKDWQEIAQKAKKQVDYKCEKCGVDLKQDKQYLHCHHIDANRANNLSSNLQVLCIKHHAEQPGHKHIEQTEKYREFLEKYKEFLENYASQ